MASEHSIEYIRRKIGLNVVAIESQLAKWRTTWLRGDKRQGGAARKPVSYSKQRLDQWLGYVDKVVRGNIDQQQQPAAAARSEKAEKNASRTTSRMGGSNQNLASKPAAVAPLPALSKPGKDKSILRPNSSGVIVVKSVADFDKVLQCIADPQLLTSPFYADFQLIIQRTKVFPDFCELILNQLRHLQPLLTRYYLSYFTDCQGLQIEPVVAYENSITEYVRDCEMLQGNVRAAVKKHKQLEVSNFRDYVNNYNNVISLMWSACMALQQLCETMKRWTDEDGGYARKLQQELTRLQAERTRLGDWLFWNRMKADDRHLSEHRASFAVAKSTAAFRSQVKAKKKLRERERRAKALIASTIAEIGEAKKRLTELRSSLPQCGARAASGVARRIGSAKRSVAQQQHEVDRLEGLVSSYRAEQRQIGDELSRARDEYTDLKSDRCAKATDWQQQSASVAQVKECLTEIGLKIEILESIISAKLGPVQTRPGDGKKSRSVYYPSSQASRSIDFDSTPPRRLVASSSLPSIASRSMENIYAARTQPLQNLTNRLPVVTAR